MVLGSFIGKLLGVINYQMFTKALQGLIAPIGVRIVDRTLTGMVLNMGQKGLRRDRLHHLGIDPAIALQQAKDDAFASRTSASLPLPSTPKIRLIHLNLARELSVDQCK
jgi:hypothetical protein